MLCIRQVLKNTFPKTDSHPESLWAFLRNVSDMAQFLRNPPGVGEIQYWLAGK